MKAARWKTLRCRICRSTQLALTVSQKANTVHIKCKECGWHDGHKLVGGLIAEWNFDGSEVRYE